MTDAERGITPTMRRASFVLAGVSLALMAIAALGLLAIGVHGIMVIVSQGAP